MENTGAILENAKARIAMLIAAGALALTAAGCSTADVEATPSTASVTAEAAPRFEVQPGADQLPLVEQYANEKPTNDFIDTTSLNVAVESEPQRLKNESTYEELLNFDDKSTEIGDSPPEGEGAPVLDFLLNSQGKLVYKDNTPGDGASDEDKKIIYYVSQQKTILEPALRTGDVDTVHFRVGKPIEADDSPEAKTEAMFIPIDYNDGGKPSIYMQMEGVDYVDGDTVKLELAHEIEHAMLGQDGTEEEYTKQDKLLLNAACKVLRDNALDAIHTYNSGVVGSLRAAQSMMKEKYRPAMGRVIKAVKNNTYAGLKIDGTDGTPNCYAQNPWDAYLTTARAEGLKGIGDPTSKANGDVFAEIINDRVLKEWDESAKESKVYHALSESTYLPEDNEEWGHAYQNTNELTATLTNLIVNEPDSFGKNVAALNKEQKASVLKIAERNIERLILTHQSERDYQKYIGGQYAMFLAVATAS